MYLEPLGVQRFRVSETGHHEGRIYVRVAICEAGAKVNQKKKEYILIKMNN